MKVIVKKAFRDKVTGKIYKVGDTITLSKARVSEVLKKGPFVEVAAKVKETKQKESKPKDD